MGEKKSQAGTRLRLVSKHTKHTVPREDGVAFETNYGPLLKTHSVSPFFRTFLRDETKQKRPFGVRGLVWFLGSGCIDSAPGPCTREGTVHLHQLYITLPTHKLGIPEFPRTIDSKKLVVQRLAAHGGFSIYSRYFMIFGVA